MTTFLLIRHGMTDDVGRALSGTAPGVHLNAVGRRQVEELAARLNGVPLTRIVSSPLERAMETAQAIAAGRLLSVEPMPALREFEVGPWTGRTIQDLESDPRWRRFNDARSVTRAPAGELMIEVQQRAVAALVDLHGRDPNGTIAVVAHGDVVRALLMFALGMPIDFVHRIEVSPARVSVVQMDGNQPRVLQVNGDTASGVA